MLADTLKRLHETEDQADNIVAKANQTVREIEKDTYQQIANLNAATEQAIAAAIAKLPQPAPNGQPNVELAVAAKQMAAAVDYVTKAVYEV